MEVSSLTIQKSYIELQKLGLIETTKGCGCFVSYKNVELLNMQFEKELEELLEKVVCIAKEISIDYKTLQESLDLLYEIKIS